ncbi:MAG: sugar transferase [Lachnospiraceae bacterium]|nr:sugar transferase [Lachnospiraceae bacterium]
MKNLESIKRIVVLQLTSLGLLMLIAGYGLAWYKFYIHVVKVSFWNKGNWLVIVIYGILLMFFTSTYGGTKIGYLKAFDVFLSQVFSILAANLISYAQLSLMSEWFAPVKPILIMTAAQLAFSFVWVFLADLIYRAVFPPRNLLLVHGDRPIDDIVRKFETRKDRFLIAGKINISAGEEEIQKEICERYDGVILWDIPTVERNKYIKFCYSKSIRVYMMPKIPDVIIMGADKMHLFDTPILLTREYALKFEERCIKRVIDIVCSLILIILTSPIMLVSAIIIKVSDRGPVFYKQVRCTINDKEFKIIKFRSMKVNAEADGKARLASKNDDRITPFGKFIRKVRIDELPQLFNILKGDMSFIGPRPERPEIIEQYVKEMPEFAYRTRVKAGLAGYAQVYGKYNTTPYDKLKLDLTYIEEYSTWLDIKLMLLTLKVLISPDATEGVDSNQVTAMKVEEGKDESTL